ncbi:MAG: capsule assembly Wzi family protein [Spirochaetaceae bacterium]|nr:capsule assembly Wzi family protein [Spirochaetaceae bacterium]
MRRTAFFFFLWALAFFAADLAAQERDQRIVALDSGIYDILSGLYREQGMLPVSSSYPYTREELRQSLRRLDFADLSGAGKQGYSHIESYLADKPVYEEDGGFRFYPEIRVNTEFYAHSKRENGEWAYDSQKRQPFFGFFADFVMAGRVDLYVDITAQKDLFQTGGDRDNHTSILTNPYQFDLNFPYRAGMSFGGAHWNFWLGRDKLSFGNGRTGNLLLSDADIFHEGARFSLNYKRFKFTWIVLGLEPWTETRAFGGEDAWDHRNGKWLKGYEYPDYLFLDANGDIIPSTPANAGRVPDGIERFKLFMAHRFELLPFDCLRIAVSESIIYGGKYPDIKVFNPMMVYHNYYQKENMNSLVTGEIDYVPIPGLLLYGQVAVDQLATSFKEQQYGKAVEPNARGFMAGIEYRHPAGSGSFTAGYEFVYTDPWLYIREHPLVSFSSTRRIQSESRKDITGDSNYLYITTPLGYGYGSDIIMNGFILSYTVAGKWAAYGEFRLIFTGDNGITSPFDTDLAYSKKTPSGDVEVKKLFILGGWYRFAFGVSLFAEGAVLRNDAGTDYQLAAGLRWRL